jgi:hypothetical protein
VNILARRIPIVVSWPFVARNVRPSAIPLSLRVTEFYSAELQLPLFFGHSFDFTRPADGFVYIPTALNLPFCIFAV